MLQRAETDLRQYIKGADFSPVPTRSYNFAMGDEGKWHFSSGGLDISMWGEIDGSLGLKDGQVMGLTGKRIIDAELYPLNDFQSFVGIPSSEQEDIEQGLVLATSTLRLAHSVVAFDVFFNALKERKIKDPDIILMWSERASVDSLAGRFGFKPAEWLKEASGDSFDFEGMVASFDEFRERFDALTPKRRAIFTRARRETEWINSLRRDPA